MGRERKGGAGKALLKRGHRLRFENVVSRQIRGATACKRHSGDEGVEGGAIRMANCRDLHSL